MFYIKPCPSAAAHGRERALPQRREKTIVKAFSVKQCRKSTERRGWKRRPDKRLKSAGMERVPADVLLPGFSERLFVSRMERIRR